MNIFELSRPNIIVSAVPRTSCQVEPIKHRITPFLLVIPYSPFAYNTC